jgi:archaellin
LQAQAQQTGQETTAEVSDVVQVGKVVGFEANNFKSDWAGGSTPNRLDNKITHINASVRLASGADPINLSKASYTIATNGNASVVEGNPQSNDGVTFTQLQSLEDEKKILADQEDMMLVEFNLSEINGINPLGSGTKLTLVTQAPAGGQSYQQLKSPKRIFEGESYIL